MKTKVLLFIILLLFYKSIFAQSNNCSINTTTSTQQSWDWTQRLWEWYDPTIPYIDNNGNALSVRNYLENPYWAVNTTNNNIRELTKELNRDYNPNDGWELLQKNLGTSGLAVYGKLNPYVILYNRHTGIIRVFINITSSYQNKSALIRLRFEKNSPQTGLISTATNIGEPLALYKLNAEQLVPNDYSNSGNNNGKYWLFADFQVNYDPCTCNIPAVIYITSFLVDTFELQATITGTSYTENSASGGSVNSTLPFNAIVGTVSGAASAYKKSYESANAFKSDVTSVYGAAIQSKLLSGARDGEKIKKLSESLSSVPVIGGVIGAASFLFTTFKGGDLSGNPIITTNYNLNVSGTLTSTNKYGEIFINVPGGNLSNLNPAFHPTYNNILGVFNLLENPVVEYRDYNPTPAFRGSTTYANPIPKNGRGVETETRLFFPKVREFRLTKLNYVLNPASGLRVKNIQFRLLLTQNETLTYTMTGPKGTMRLNYNESNKSLAGPYEPEFPYDRSKTYDERLFIAQGIEIANWPEKNNIKNVTYSTIIKDISCIYDTRMKFFVTNPSIFPELKFDLMVTLENINDTSKVIFIKQTYDVTLIPSLLSTTNNYTTVQTQKIVANPNYPCRGCSPTTTIYGWKATINEYWPNAHPSTTCSGYTPTTIADVTKFCTSQKYKSTPATYTNLKTALNSTIIEEVLEPSIVVYPNPVTNASVTSVQLQLPEQSNVNISVLDAFGRTIQTVTNEYLMDGEYEFNINTQTLSDGVYFIHLKTDQFSSSQKLILLN